MGTPSLATSGNTNVSGLFAFDTALHRVEQAGFGPSGELTRDPDGNLWYGAEGRLWRLQAERFVPAGNLPEAWGREAVTGLAAGCAGGTWVTNTRLGLWRQDGQTWRRNGDMAGLPDKAPLRLLCDQSRRLWLGYQDGTVCRVDHSRVDCAGSAQGLDVGRVTDISVGTNVLVAGENGLAMAQGDRFLSLTAAHPSAFEGITGIAQAKGGDVWLNGPGGMARVALSDLPTSSAAATRPVPVRMYDETDGYPGPGLTRPDHPPGIAVDSRGRVWVSGFGGVAYIDAANAGTEREQVHALLRDVRANDEAQALTGQLKLPKGTRSLRFEYTALDYVHPERLRFRHRLERIDRDWVDNRDRREANYANMGPGTYTFSVEVSDETGAWTATPASITVTIAPTFVQSWYFMVLCLVAAAALTLLAFQLRVRHFAAGQQRLHEERLLERERIARELHDTLLQGTQALIMKVHAATKLVGKNEPIHQVLDKALEQSTDVMVEARNRIEDLRVRSGPEDNDLPAALIRYGQEFGQGGSPCFEASVEGKCRELVSRISQEARLIGREALSNAFHHAKAARIELQIEFGDEHFKLRVRDDGLGFDDKVLSRAVGGRHWGLPGMQERAREISAALTVWSRPDAGTEVELQVPARVAYQAVAPRRRWSALLSALGYPS